MLRSSGKVHRRTCNEAQEVTNNAYEDINVLDALYVASPLWYLSEREDERGYWYVIVLGSCSPRPQRLYT